MTTQDFELALLIGALVVNVLVAGLLAWTGWSARLSAKAASLAAEATKRSGEAAFRAAQATERATLAELVPGLMKECGSPEMHNYGVKLVNFAKRAQEEGNFPCQIPYGVEALEMPWDPEVADLDHARRYFEQFHIRVYARRELGLIDDDTVRMIISEYDVEVLLKQYLVPMLREDKGFTKSRFFKTIPLWERLYRTELLADHGSPVRPRVNSDGAQQQL